MEVNVDDYLDHRNTQLWNTLNSKYAISVALNGVPEYACYSKNETVVIYVNPRSRCVESFTHELLHVYLHSKGVDIGASLVTLYYLDELLGSLYPVALIEHIGNCLDHQKILPYYLQLGFDRSKFISDYNTRRCSMSELKLIESGVKNGNWSSVADKYIGYFFSIKARPDFETDYSKELVKLESMDSQLFGLLNEFWNFWDSYDIERENLFLYGYREQAESFLKDLKMWSKKNVW